MRYIYKDAFLSYLAATDELIQVTGHRSPLDTASCFGVRG